MHKESMGQLNKFNAIQLVVLVRNMSIQFAICDCDFTCFVDHDSILPLELYCSLCKIKLRPSLIPDKYKQKKMKYKTRTHVLAGNWQGIVNFS